MIAITVKLRVAEWTDYGTDKPGDAGLRMYPEYLDHPDEADSMFAIDAGILVIEGERLTSMIEAFEDMDQLPGNLDSEVDMRTVTLTLSDTPPGDAAEDSQAFHADLYETERFAGNDVVRTFVLRDPGRDEQVGIFELDEAKLVDEPAVDWETDEWTFEVAQVTRDE